MKITSAILVLAVLIMLFLSGCGDKPKPEKRKTAPAVTTQTAPPPSVVHVVKKVERGHWKHFGVVGSVYRADTKPGTMDGIEGGLMAFKTLNGPVWFADFEPNDNRDPLDTRKVYLVHISSNLAKGCGYAMKEFHTAPKQCVMEEKITSWEEAKKFLKPKDWEEIEKFLRRRQWK